MRSILSFCILMAVLTVFSPCVSAQTFNLELDIEGAIYHQTHTVLPLPPLGGGGPLPIVCDDYPVIGYFYDFSGPASRQLVWHHDDEIIVVDLPFFLFSYTLADGSDIQFRCHNGGTVSVLHNGELVADGTYSVD